MPVEFHYLEPNVLHSIQKAPFSPDDIATLQGEIARLIEEHGLVYVISDLREVDLTFGDIVAGMAQSTDGSAGYKSGDSGMEMIMLTSQELAAQMVEYYKQDQYGNLQITATDTMEKALAYVESKKGKNSAINQIR